MAELSHGEFVTVTNGGNMFFTYRVDFLNDIVDGRLKSDFTEPEIKAIINSLLFLLNEQTKRGDHANTDD